MTQRSTKYSHGREIEVLEFTPSAVTAVLMSSAKPIYGGPSSFDVMLKHLSTEGSFDHLSKSIGSSNSVHISPDSSALFLLIAIYSLFASVYRSALLIVASKRLGRQL